MRRKATHIIVVPLLATMLLALRPVPPTVLAGPPHTAAASLVEGRGWWEKAVCLGCVAAFAAASGGTVAGVIAVGSMFPEYVAACGLACIQAYTEQT